MTLILFASSGALLFMIVFLIALAEDAPVRRASEIKTSVAPASALRADVLRDTNPGVTEPAHDKCSARAA